MVLGGLAFFVAGFVQLKVQAAEDALGGMEAEVIFTNGVQDPGQLLFQYEGQVPFNLSYGMVSWGVCGSMPCSSFMPRPVEMIAFLGGGGGGGAGIEVWGQD